MAKGPLPPPPRLESLTQFVRYLTSRPTPERVGSALARGPLSILGARSTEIRVAVDDTRLVLISQHGLTREEASRKGSISLDLAVPVTRSHKECLTIRTDAREAVSTMPAYALDEELWISMLDRLDARVLISTPIICDGASIGTLAIFVSDSLAWHDVDVAYIEMIAATLGLWMDNPHSGVREALGISHSDVDVPLSFTARQMSVLQFIDQDATNVAMARTLGYSVSTVRAEVQTIYRTLRAHDRTSAKTRAHELGILH